MRSETGDLRNVLVDAGGRRYRSFQARGTPGALVIGADGRIGSWVATGRDAIERLVARTLAAREPSGSDRLPVGADAPPFELPALDGAPVALSSFRGEDVLLVFWNPSCGFCRTLRPELLALERAPGTPRLVIVSAGGAPAIRAEGFRSTVLLDERLSAGGLFGARGTPMAVLVGADGRVASPLAAGAPAVLALARGER